MNQMEDSFCLLSPHPSFQAAVSGSFSVVINADPSLTQVMKTLLGVLLSLFYCGLIWAAPHANYPKIDDTSYTETNGNRVIRLSVEVAASPDAVWELLTTAEGWKRYAVAFAVLDMNIGGILETSYNPKAQRGDPDNIKNQIVAYVPKRMLAIRCVQAPRSFQHKEEFYATSTVFEVIPLGKQRTQIVLTAVGYLPGQAYDELFKQFRWGDAYTLEKLRQLYEPDEKTSKAGNP